MLGGTALVAFADGTWIVKNNGRAEPPDPLLAEHIWPYSRRARHCDFPRER